jgi:hypothetical protein
LQSALVLNARIGAHPWTARTQWDLAGLMRARDLPADRERALSLEDAALITADRLGMTALAARVRAGRAAGEWPVDAGGPVESGHSVVANTLPTVFRRDGDYWSLAYATDAFRLRDAKGLHYLAQLLRHPGKEFHVLDLVTAVEGADVSRPRPGATQNDGLVLHSTSDAGPGLDERAKSSYRARLRELEEELDEATAWADSGRAARIREEMDFLADELVGAVGLGGRDRKAGSPAERARVNITRTVRSALGRIRDHSAVLE